MMEAKVCELINEIACLDELNTIIVVTHDVTAAAPWLITCGLWDATATETEMSFLAHAFRKRMTLSSATFAGTRSSRTLQDSWSLFAK